MSKFQVHNYSVDFIIQKYRPLIDNLIRKYMSKYGYLTNPTDLEAEALLRIPELIRKYDPKLGVDFDYYIKNMLNWDMLHYVEKLIRVNKLQVNVKENYEFRANEILTESALLDIPKDVVLTDSQRYYLTAVVIHNKTSIMISKDLGKPLQEVRDELEELAKWIIEVSHV